MKNEFITFALITFLAGCDAAKEAMDQVVQEQQPMTLVFSPGIKMLVGGQAAPVHGFEKCPKGDGIVSMLFGPEPGEGQQTCVVVSPESKSVDVLVGFPGGPVRETWVVERTGDRTMLRRADGSYLTEAR